MNKIRKDFDAVLMMRQIREKMLEEMEQNPALFEQKLEAVREKWRFDKQKPRLEKQPQE